MSSLAQKQQQLDLLLQKLQETIYILQKKGESFGPTALFSALLAFTSPTSESSTDFSEIAMIIEKSKKINKAICFCKEILRKQESSELLTETEMNFLEYIFMVSQLSSGFIKDIRSLNSSFCHNFDQYVSSLESVLTHNRNKFNAFEKYITYSIFHYHRNKNGILAGSPSKKPRNMTREDHDEYQSRSKESSVKSTKFRNERDHYLRHKSLFLERFSRILQLVSDTAQRLEFDDFPEFDFFESGFNAQKFTSVRDEYLKIQEIFQSLNDEIKSFSIEINSLTIRNQIEPESDPYLTEWNRCYENGLRFLGKQD